jgi:hypothetical protein
VAFLPELLPQVVEAAGELRLHGAWPDAEQVSDVLFRVIAVEAQHDHSALADRDTPKGVHHCLALDRNLAGVRLATCLCGSPFSVSRFVRRPPLPAPQLVDDGAGEVRVEVLHPSAPPGRIRTGERLGNGIFGNRSVPAQQDGRAEQLRMA